MKNPLGAYYWASRWVYTVSDSLELFVERVVCSAIMASRNKASKTPQIEGSKAGFVPQEQDCYEGERLACFLKLIQREINSTRISDGNSLPEKIWLKQQFAIGINDVTRVLERMSPIDGVGCSPQQPHAFCSNRKVPSVRLQAVLIASDCNPRWLTKHLPSLASTRKVPVIFVKDKKGGSLRLGELVKLKTAIAIGVKAKGNAINQIIEKILHGNEINLDKECLKSTEMPGAPCQ